MVVWEINKLILFLIFIIPGFISIKVYDLIIAGERRDFSKSIYEMIGFSALNFAALSWLIILIHSGDFYSTHKYLYVFSIFIILFIFPIFWPILFSGLAKWKCL